MGELWFFAGRILASARGGRFAFGTSKRPHDGLESQDRVIRLEEQLRFDRLRLLI